MVSWDFLRTNEQWRKSGYKETVLSIAQVEGILTRDTYAEEKEIKFSKDTKARSSPC